MGNGLNPRFFGVVDKIPLYVIIRGFPDDFDGILVGPHGTIRSEPVEHTVKGVLDGLQPLPNLQALMGNIVLDANGKVVDGFRFIQFVKYSLDHGRVEFLAGEPVTTSQDLWHFPLTFLKGGNHIQIEGFTRASGFFGPVENRHFLNGFGKGVDKMGDGERPEKAYDHCTDFFPVFHHGIHGFDDRTLSGPHDYNDLFCFGMSYIIE